jgi:transmembrane sensor
MEKRRCNKLNQQISEEAAEWFIEFRSDDIDAEGRRAFDAWVRTSPEHLRAFIEMAALWREAGSIDPERKRQVEDLILCATAESNVVALEAAHHLYEVRDSADHIAAHTVRADQVQPASRQRVRPVRKLATAAAILIGLLGAGFVAWTQFSGQRTYSTEVGEQRSIRLADGSTITLDSRSRVRVVFTDSLRAVELLQGRALFHVAKGSSKPFVVHAHSTTVRAVGTQFDVDENRSSTVVTVVEGRVAVYSTPDMATASVNDFGANASNTVSSEYPTRPTARPRTADSSSYPAGAHTYNDATAVFLSAGEQIKLVDGQGSAEPAHADVSSATAWTQGQLVLESATLAEVAEQFNRYSARKLVAEDHGMPPIRLSGVFATDPDFLIRYLRNRPDVIVHESDDEIELVRTAVD